MNVQAHPYLQNGIRHTRELFNMDVTALVEGVAKAYMGGEHIWEGKNNASEYDAKVLLVLCTFR